jgi:CheY-like chemotaxis protein
VGVVLLDATLPGIDGREVLSRLQAIHPNVKVIFTSAYTQAQVVGCLESHQSVRFIRKPYQFGELVELLLCPLRGIGCLPHFGRCRQIS